MILPRGSLGVLNVCSTSPADPRVSLPEMPWIARIRALVAGRPDLADLLARQAASMPTRVFGGTCPSAAQFLEVYLEEALFLLELVRPRLRPGVRILEIGGGLGLFHVLAHAEGVNIVSIEPSTAGFSVFRSFGVELLTELTGHPERFVDGRVEELKWSDPQFELIVSNNVLEHVADVERALREMYRVLLPGGMLLHGCPNYLFPYEPHYKVPVIPCAVKMTGQLFWRAFRSDPLWQSLNSINAQLVKRVARRLPGAQLVFHHTLAQILARLDKGGPLADRHDLLARIALTPFARVLLTALPPQLATPMVFEISKPRS